MEEGNYEHAVESFEHARVRLGDRTDQPPLLVSLVGFLLMLFKIVLDLSQISGWKFDELAITIQQRFCEALFAAGRTKEAGEFVLRLVNQEVDMMEPMKTWVSGELLPHLSSHHIFFLNITTDFVQRCLQTPGNIDNTSGDAINSAKAQVSQETSHPTPLSREWARSRLMTGSWKDALTAAAGVSMHLLSIHRVLDDPLSRSLRSRDSRSIRSYASIWR